MGQSDGCAVERGGVAGERRPAMNRLVTAVLLAGLISVGLSCGGDGPTMSGPGDLKGRLMSPNSGLDTAIVFTIPGPAALAAAVAAPGLPGVQQPLGGTSTRSAL